MEIEFPEENTVDMALCSRLLALVSQTLINCNNILLNYQLNVHWEWELL